MHTMTMVKEHEGTEEWMCFACDRHLLVSWTPVFEKTILLMGDSSAKHTGIKNKLKLNQAYLSGDVQEPIQDAKLVPWNLWMDQIGFENLWDREG